MVRDGAVLAGEAGLPCGGPTSLAPRPLLRPTNNARSRV
jgi:hypothetical protein